MPVLNRPAGPTHELPGTRFRSLATPSLGAAETAVWQIEIEPGTAATPPHALTREEVFVVLAGAASVRLGDDDATAVAGDAIVVPPGVAFTLANAGAGTLHLVCCLPVGGRARLDDGTEFTPPWAE
jgi:quercetin dioxygenase-like cupin family protein